MPATKLSSARRTFRCRRGVGMPRQGWAFYANEGADPWEFQFGLDYSQPGPTGAMGTPVLRREWPLA